MYIRSHVMKLENTIGAAEMQLTKHLVLTLDTHNIVQFIFYTEKARHTCIRYIWQKGEILTPQ